MVMDNEVTPKKCELHKVYPKLFKDVVLMLISNHNRHAQHHNYMHITVCSTCTVDICKVQYI